MKPNISPSHGPWMVINENDQLQIRSKYGLLITVIRSCESLPDEVDQVNANLMALAPELLNALKELRAVAALVPDTVWAKASDKYNEQFNPETINDYHFTMDIARDVIKKVEGE